MTTQQTKPPIDTALPNGANGYDYQKLIDMYLLRIVQYEQQVENEGIFTSHSPAWSDSKIGLSRASINAIRETHAALSENLNAFSLPEYRYRLEEELENEDITDQRQEEIAQILDYIGEAESFTELAQIKDWYYEGSYTKERLESEANHTYLRNPVTGETHTVTDYKDLPDNKQINYNIGALKQMQAQRFETLNQLRTFAMSSKETSPAYFHRANKNLPHCNPNDRYYEAIKAHNKNEYEQGLLEFRFAGEKHAYNEMSSILTSSPKWKEVCAFMASQYQPGSKEHTAWKKGDISSILPSPSLKATEAKAISRPEFAALKAEVEATNKAHGEFAMFFNAFNDYHAHLANQQLHAQAKDNSLPRHWNGNYHDAYFGMHKIPTQEAAQMTLLINKDIAAQKEEIQKITQRPDWKDICIAGCECYADIPELANAFATQDIEKIIQSCPPIQANSFEERLQLRLQSQSNLSKEQKEAQKVLLEGDKYYLLYSTLQGAIHHYESSLEQTANIQSHSAPNVARTIGENAQSVNTTQQIINNPNQMMA